MGVEQAAEFLAEEGFVDAGGKGFGGGHAWMPGRQRGRGMARVEAHPLGVSRITGSDLPFLIASPTKALVDRMLLKIS